MTTDTKKKTNGAATQSRMTLDAITREIERQPDRILMVGTEGVGKTTFAADAPSPIFLCAEDGLPPVLGEVPRFPTPESYPEVLEALRVLVREDHDFETVVIDTIDWLEPMIWDELCTRNSWESIESPGYGKGYVAATGEWRKLLSALDVLRDRKGMEVILLAHATIKTFANPAGDDYGRYECKLHRGAAALVREWCDVNLFAVHEEFVTEKKGRAKGVSTGRRVIHTERTAAWDAKNRYALPAELPLSYDEYSAAREAGLPADPEDMWTEAVDLIDSLGLDEETKNETTEWLERHRDRGPARLAQALDTLRSKVTEKGAA